MIEVRGNSRVQVRKQIRSVRTLRSDLYALAEAIAGDPGLRGQLVLKDAKISEGRIEEERRIAEQVFHPDLFERLQIVLGGSEPIQEPAGVVHLKRADSWFEITKLLLRQYLLGKGPVTTRWIMKTVGCTYPTAAKALNRLEPVLARHSDRSVGLSRFPRDALDELLVRARLARSTFWYVDRSGQPRSPEILLERLAQRRLEHVAVGGSQGARHWYSELNLSGNPRLDLTVHCPGSSIDLGFIDDLDPALVRVKSPTPTASVVVHAMRREVHWFEPGPMPWADVVECLLDLHAIGLQQQAVEFREYLESSRVQS